jgi:hypothetical protein
MAAALISGVNQHGGGLISGMNQQGGGLISGVNQHGGGFDFWCESAWRRL